MKRKTFKLAGLLMLITGLNTLQAQNADPINVVTTAVPFLRISPDARAGGMGELGVATSPDAASSFYNLSKTPFAKNPYGLALTYTPWLKDLGLNDVYLMALSGYYKLDELSALSASVRYFSLGNITFTDYNAIDNGTFRPREFGVDLGYSRKLSDKLALGIALRYISSNLTGGGYSNGLTTYKPGSAVAGDVSLFYTGADESGQGWNFGAAVSNLGTKIGYTNDATQKDYIPANLSFGTTYT
ncbi:MAG: type IX secretion system outer membrane channel protein PorV, partial [Pedobacter sp.]